MATMIDITELVVATRPGLLLGPHSSETSVVKVTVGYRNERGQVVGNHVVARLSAGDTYEFYSCAGRVIEIAEELLEDESDES